MVDLTTTYGGVKIKNPLIIGGGPCTSHPDICAKAAKAGWAGLVLKTYFGDTLKRYPGFAETPWPIFKLADARGRTWRPTVPKASDGRSRDGKKLGKVEPDYSLVMVSQMDPMTGDVIAGHESGYYDQNPDRYLWYTNETKKAVKGTDCKVIASIASFEEEGWAEGCDMINKSDADMVEVNLGCGILGTIHPKTGRHVNIGMGNWPELVEKWTKFCTERIKGIPVLVKLPPHCRNPILSARTAVENGAVGIQFGDAGLYIPPLPPVYVDPETMELGFAPGIPFAHPLIPGGWSLPFICGFIAQFRLNGITQDISGCGGVRDYSDILRLLMCGATSTQAVTVCMVEGVNAATELLRDITAWMERKGHKSIKEIIGIVATLDKLKTDPLKFSPHGIPQHAGGPIPSVKIVVDQKKCIKCGWCEECCYNLAPKVTDNGAVIDDKLCEICGMCVALCPQQCISIVNR